MKNRYSSFLLMLFCIIISVMSVISDLSDNFILLLLIAFFLAFRFKEILYIPVKKYILFSGIVFTSPIYFIFPDDIILFDRFSVSAEGLYIFVLLSLRLTVFYFVFEITTNIVSPAGLFNDLSRAGFDDIALLSSVTLNQLSNISFIIQEVFSNFCVRFSKKERFLNINLFIMSILRISMKKADDLAFSLYCTETCLKGKTQNKTFLKKNDAELLFIPVIMIAIKIISAVK